MATTIRARVLVTYQTPLEKWKRAISLVLESMRNGKIEFRDIGFTDFLQANLEAGHCPTNQQIDLMNKTLDMAGIKSLD